jgi:hypothetical protein
MLVTGFRLICFIVLLLFNCCCIPKTANATAFGMLAAAESFQKDTSLNGLYTGLEYMGVSVDPANPGKKFKSYHPGYLKIKGDSVFLDQNLNENLQKEPYSK